MRFRALITIAVWLLWGMPFLVRDGQIFRHALVILSCSVAGSVPWLPLLARRHEPRRRRVALAVVGFSAGMAVAAAIDLPRAYESQRRFNERARVAEREWLRAERERSEVSR